MHKLSTHDITFSALDFFSAKKKKRLRRFSETESAHTLSFHDLRTLKKKIKCLVSWVKSFILHFYFRCWRQRQRSPLLQHSRLFRQNVADWRSSRILQRAGPMLPQDRASHCFMSHVLWSVSKTTRCLIFQSATVLLVLIDLIAVGMLIHATVCLHFSCC